MKNDYAVYKGDEFLFMGTIKEIATHFNVKKETVYFWTSPTQKKRAKSRMKIAIKVEEWKEK